MNVNLGIDTPATFNILMKHAGGGLIGEPYSKAIAPIVPPKTFTMTWDEFPNLGDVTVQPVLTAGPGQSICSEWVTLDTGN